MGSLVGGCRLKQVSTLAMATSSSVVPLLGRNRSATATDTATDTATAINDGGYDSSKRALLFRKAEVQARLRELESGGGGDEVPPVDDDDDDVASVTTMKALISALPDATRPVLPLTISTTTGGEMTLTAASAVTMTTATDAPSASTSLPRVDVHWDYALKEMAWLSADFRSERKRQIAQARRLSNAILQHHATLSARRMRERAAFEAKVRRLAGRMARMVRDGYWKKMERVVEYKQRLEGEERRRKEMDGRLVFLVRQTERYGESLRNDERDEGRGIGDGGRKITIEEALSSGTGSRARCRSMSGSSRVDYTRMDRDVAYDDESTSFFYYGKGDGGNDQQRRRGLGIDAANNNKFVAVEDSDDDGSYALPEEDEMAIEAQIEEMEYSALLLEFEEEYKREDIDAEVRMLLEERDVDVEDLILRLIEEGREDEAEEGGEGGGGAASSTRAEDVGKDEEVAGIIHDAMDLDEECDDDSGANEIERKKSVRFVPIDDEMTPVPAKGEYAFHGDDEADDKDIDDEEDETGELSDAVGCQAKSVIGLLDDDDHEEKDEFHLERDELDDETTIEVEERLGRDMSYHDEIELLKREGEMSIEELRAMYANIEEGGDEDNNEDEDALSEGDSSVENDEDLSKVSALALLDEDDHEEKDEFHLERDELDDETTIEVEERLGRDMSYHDEIELLKREGEMSIEELRAMYPNIEEGEDEDNNEDEEALSEGDSSVGNDEDLSKVSALALLDEDDHEEKDEFHLEGDELDDETTIEVEERLGRDMSYEDEIELLKREGEMSVEELRAMYANMNKQSNDDEISEVEYDELTECTETLVDESSKRKHSLIEESTVHDGAHSKKSKMEGDEGISALASLAASDTKARETMLTRPFLLASWVKLRAYQHVGLNWLVSIQTRRLNGILADEMGLGKTLQTISMLAYLASYKGLWGPHLIIVPTSCLVNWEVEFKRFCPGLKVMCYYGNAKKRKELRTGWTKPNIHHVVITSYQLAVQDAFAFKRKKWYYLILDEAHNIKNFESQRWQTLISFNTQRRLLLTGTPLQNNLMELWSLLHFLMPHVFTDRKQFSYWFSNPMDNIIEGNAKRNDDLIKRLHGIIRPFLLRRLKKDVEKQLPGKYEHIIKCQLSRRQMFLYEEFMARSSTRKAVSGGNFMGMMNVLMQLRKVCNHPDLFEPRSVTTPFVMERLTLSTASCVVRAIEPTSALDELSSFLRLPLWTMGQGSPSFQKSISVDQIVAGQLFEYMTPESIIVENVTNDDLTEPMPPPEMAVGISSFLYGIRATEKHERVSRAKFVSGINKRRCETLVFPYSDRLRRAVSVVSDLCYLPLKDDLNVSQIAATPMELLAMRKSQEDRANDLDEIVDKFVFCVPKAGTLKPMHVSPKRDSTSLISEKTLAAKTSTAVENYFAPFAKAMSRLTMCFPDKKLVQFDAGKLQTLATLLRELKHGGHRVLIFTQMSKMLDLLESFLNLNGHTYLRLDGATDVDKRQRLMDRFNNDSKIFCFILSTRSGGLGINLTGADSVVFYDSDWNPAMDAQAQDRAHRIGQTREVHIYRMVTEYSIEENILTKAKQKRNLDLLVMDEGKFHATAPDESSTGDVGAEGDAFTKDKLQRILGIHAENDDLPISSVDDTMSNDQLESAMAALEDEDDVVAMRNTRQEAIEALKEFDESIQYKQDEIALVESNGKEEKDEVVKLKNKILPNSSSAESDNHKLKHDDASDDEKEMEKEFAQWQRKVGMDANTIYESLTPLERYGLHVKEQIDPYYSKYFWAEQQRLQTTNTNNEWNIEEIEQKKVKEEQQAFEDGDLLATFPEAESLPRQRQLYIREKARLRSDTMRRKLTGQNWNARLDDRSGNVFWYNADTGEVLGDKPQVLRMLEAEEVARTEGWSALPHKPLVHIMDFLIPYPERIKCTATCRRWKAAATDASFVLHVWPVELGALVMDVNKLGKNHFRTIADANRAALPGDSIGLVVNKPIKFVGDENEPAHVVLEMSGEMLWESSGGWMEGITIRRPRISMGMTHNTEILRIEAGARLDMFNCVFDNRGSIGNCVSVMSDGAGGRWEKATINGGSRDYSGLLIEKNAKVELIDCCICENDGVGITHGKGAIVTMIDCTVERNGLALSTKKNIVVSLVEPDYTDDRLVRLL
ncbi:hypothetical protein ACHAXA_005548 [Cyclostephanos tholiformis]|uniref:Uncharacterized protein n=1 Tax=Cyclostephanos tholiformis TaxID=382380 RepID=A0ABD3RHR2_9STRA